MRRIFLNDDLERAISDNGYVVINNFAKGDICRELTDFFEETDTVDKRAFTITNWNNDIDYRDKTYREIVKQLNGIAGEYLIDYRPVIAVYTCKRPEENSEMLIHQDWSLVDETQYRSVSIWLALCDMNVENGNLQVAPGSHIYSGTPRGMNIPIPFENIRSHMQMKVLVDVPLRKGDAVIFDHRLIHASPPNKTTIKRLAAVLAMIPSEAELIHYYKDQENDEELEILKMNDKEFHLIDFFDMPNKPKHISHLDRIPFSFSPISIEAVKM